MGVFVMIQPKYQNDSTRISVLKIFYGSKTDANARFRDKITTRKMEIFPINSENFENLDDKF